MKTPIEIPRDYTASDLEEEHRVAYFREDLGINLHHWHWHLVYPFDGAREIVNKNRRGELFYYMHQQVIARYFWKNWFRNSSISLFIPDTTLNVFVTTWNAQSVYWTLGNRSRRLTSLNWTVWLPVEVILRVLPTKLSVTWTERWIRFIKISMIWKGGEIGFSLPFIKDTLKLWEYNIFECFRNLICVFRFILGKWTKGNFDWKWRSWHFG